MCECGPGESYGYISEEAPDVHAYFLLHYTHTHSHLLTFPPHIDLLLYDIYNVLAHCKSSLTMQASSCPAVGLHVLVYTESIMFSLGTVLTASEWSELPFGSIEAVFV